MLDHRGRSYINVWTKRIQSVKSNCSSRCSVQVLSVIYKRVTPLGKTPTHVRRGISNTTRIGKDFVANMVFGVSNIKCMIIKPEFQDRITVSKCELLLWLHMCWLVLSVVLQVALCQLHIRYLIHLPYTLVYYILAMKMGCFPPNNLISENTFHWYVVRIPRHTVGHKERYSANFDTKENSQGFFVNGGVAFFRLC
ncbi:hypothetical protein T11_9551 [Trichinella zimbabwensis]|uniref:Uncharacterized protein n=1 Tax=Trichinella zimbabwensis TaxID=268475 RepID=A0A0V1I5H9_9BILA|nr:hypothetical protein T11_9551 [Trichinella zimbabwensis]